MNTLRSLFNSDRLRAISILLALLGAINAAYLSITKFTETPIICLTGGGCETVRSSPYALLMGIPVEFLGLFTYLVLIALFAAEWRWPLAQEYGPIAVFGIGILGTLFSAYLQYTSLFLLKATCNYCIFNFFIMLIGLILAILRLRKRFQEDAA